MTRPAASARRDHLDPEQVLALAEGSRPSAAARTHLERCEPCRDRVAASEALVQELRLSSKIGALLEPPAPTLQAAIAMFPQRPPLAERVIETVARLLRGAAPDGALSAPAIVGVRGSSAATRLLYRAPDLEIEIELSEERGGVRVGGQILAREPRELPLLVWAERDGHLLREAAVSGFGALQLEPIAQGSFDLVLDFGSRRVRLPVTEPAA